MGHSALEGLVTRVDPGVPRGSFPRQAASSHQERSRVNKADAQILSHLALYGLPGWQGGAAAIRSGCRVHFTCVWGKD